MTDILPSGKPKPFCALETRPFAIRAPALTLIDRYGFFSFHPLSNQRIELYIFFVRDSITGPIDCFQNLRITRYLRSRASCSWELDVYIYIYTWFWFLLLLILVIAKFFRLELPGGRFAEYFVSSWKYKVKKYWTRVLNNIIPMGRKVMFSINKKTFALFGLFDEN